MLKTEVTQELYQKVMGENPSYSIILNNPNLPVETVSWYDAIYFCNKLSILLGYKPAYAVNGSTDITTWNYVPHTGMSLGKIQLTTDGYNYSFYDERPGGFRLPTDDEWVYAAKGGKSYKYAGSNKVSEVAWYNVEDPHPVAQKNPNAYGLYDMSGNIAEWCFTSFTGYIPGIGSYAGLDYRYFRGGSFYTEAVYCKIDEPLVEDASSSNSLMGFRIVQEIK